MVAIPAVWFYNYFTTKIENLTVEMTYVSKELIDYLIKSVGASLAARSSLRNSRPRKR